MVSWAQGFGIYLLLYPFHSVGGVYKYRMYYNLLFGCETLPNIPRTLECYNSCTNMWYVFYSTYRDMKLDSDVPLCWG